MLVRPGIDLCVKVGDVRAIGALPERDALDLREIAINEGYEPNYMSSDEMRIFGGREIKPRVVAGSYAGPNALLDFDKGVYHYNPREINLDRKKAKPLEPKKITQNSLKRKIWSPYPSY